MNLQPEVASAFRAAVAQRVRFWDAAIHLEDLIGQEIPDEVFSAAASDCATPEAALELSDEAVSSYLRQ